jgi:hypothetical protein
MAQIVSLKRDVEVLNPQHLRMRTYLEIETL